MTEVVDIIHNLSYQVTDPQNLKNVVDNFKQQAAAIEDLTRKKEILEKFGGKESDPRKAALAKQGVIDLTKQINNQTAALTKQVAASNILQKAATQELGIIQRLTDKINDLQQARERQTTKSGIAEINKELQQLQQELISLTKIDSALSNEKGILSSLLGVGSASGAGKQVLQGVLSGAGIGVGFSVIPALTASLIEYVGKLLDTRNAVYEANEAVQTLNSSLAQQLSSFIEINKTISDSFGGGQTAFQLGISRAAAPGVVNGETFQDRKRRFDAEQEARKAEIAQVDEIGEKYRKLNNILLDYDNSKNRGGTLLELFKQIEDIGLSETELNRINKSIRDTFEKINELPKDERQAARKRLRLSENDELVQQRARNATEANKIQEEIAIAEVAFKEETNRQIFELDRKLRLDIATAQDKFAQDQIKREETTADSIEKSYQIRGEAAVRALNKERELAVKAGIDTAKIEKDFDEKFNLIVKENEAAKLEDIRKFYLAQLQLQTAFNQQSLQNDVTALRNRLSGTSVLNESEQLDIRREIVAKELEIQQAKISSEYTNEVQALEKLQAERRARGEQTATEYELTQKQIEAIQAQSIQKQEDAQRSSNVRSLNIYTDYYKDLLGLIQVQQNLITSELKLDLSAKTRDIEINGTSFIENVFFGIDFEKKIALRRGQIKQFASDIEANRARLEAANKRKSNAEDNLATQTGLGNQSGINAATADLKSAQTEVNNLNAAINNGEEQIKATSRSIRTDYVQAIGDSFKEMAQQAVNAYNTISDARQQDLQREISVREQRVEMAYKLAERGNTVALQQEQERLDAANKAHRKAALEQQAINSALALSSSIVAIAQAAALPPPANLIAIPAVIAALAAGYTTISALTRAQQTTGFEGGGYTGDIGTKQVAGVVHGQEYVSHATATKKYRTELEMMNKGIFPKMPDYAVTSTNAGVTRYEFEMLGKKLDSIESAVMTEKTHVNINEQGIYIATTNAQRADQRRFRGA